MKKTGILIDPIVPIARIFIEHKVTIVILLATYLNQFPAFLNDLATFLISPIHHNASSSK